MRQSCERLIRLTGRFAASCKESRLHLFMGRDATTILPTPDPDTSPSTIASLIKMAFQQTTCHRIAFE